MQDWKLTVNKVIEHAHLNHGMREVVTRSVEGPIVRSNYSELYWRARKCSNALLADGVQMGDRIATLAWNTQRHIETWYGTMCIGAVLHTLNPRLFPEQIAWIINHAEDTHVFYDITFQPIIEAIKDKVPSVKHWIVLTDAAHKPQSGIANLRTYEEYIGGQSTDVVWGDFPEETACGLCYTSGTTGDPKGVLYSHRSNVMHTMIGLQKDAIGIGAADTTLPVVPMFHANAWGLAFSGPATGSKLVLPGAKMDGESIYELLENEKVTFTAAVPTVWLMLLQYLESTNKKLPHLNRVVIGGSAVPTHPARVRRELSGRSAACLGHDRDEPAGFAWLHDRERARSGPRHHHQVQVEAGPPAVWRRDEDHQRRGRAAAARWQDSGTSGRARSGGRQGLLQERRRQHS
jgi:fatty-acyl-CoA synthase